MKILVTGANGLLGSAVTEEVLRRGHTCIATGRAPQPRCADATVYAQADLCDPQAVQALYARTRSRTPSSTAPPGRTWTAQSCRKTGRRCSPSTRDGTKNVADGLPRRGLQADLHHDGLRL